MNRLDSDTKCLLTVQCAVAAAGFAVCMFLSKPAAVVLLICGITVILAELVVLSHRRKKLSKLCDDIDKILHGAESVSIEESSEGEISVLSSELHKMTIMLREQNSALKHEKQFLKESLEDISHQLRTPLTTILVILGMLRRNDMPREERAEHISEMFTLLSKMQWLLETLLSISRLDAGAVTLKPEKLSASEVVNSALEPLFISIELKNITVIAEYDGEPSLTADKQYITEAVENILKNCMEHDNRDGFIKISASENDIYTQITISDTGGGIPENELPHIFERFYRGTGFSNKGYGIGLAFAKKTAEAHNGTLSVKNTADRAGAEFELRIYKTTI